MGLQGIGDLGLLLRPLGVTILGHFREKNRRRCKHRHRLSGVAFACRTMILRMSQSIRSRNKKAPDVSTSSSLPHVRTSKKTRDALPCLSRRLVSNATIPDPPFALDFGYAPFLVKIGSAISCCYVMALGSVKVQLWRAKSTDYPVKPLV